MIEIEEFKKLAKLIRYYILLSTTTAGSGHPTSSLSATDLMTALFFGGFFHFDLDNPDNPNNDRLIFSKGHASPLFYSLYLAAGAITPEEMLTLRKFDSNLEGHPTPRFRYTEAATGSLGQGLSVGVGMALAIRKKISDIRFQISEKGSKISNIQYPISTPRVYVLLGDGETAEGSIWEAAAVASHYKLNNLIAIVDVNRLGQSGETMLGWDTDTYKKKFEAFGWDVLVIDGHDYSQIFSAMKQCNNRTMKYKPLAIIAKTVKGKGVKLLENKEGWHGKPLPQDKLEQALKELGEVDLKIRRKPAKPETGIMNNELRIKKKNHTSYFKLQTSYFKLNDQVATREAYGQALTQLGEAYPDIVALDGEVSNSTYSEIFRKKFPDRYFEMFIAEQNMVGTAVGFARLGYVPFVSSFAAFLTRGFDQIRMAALGRANIKFCGSHAGVSIGEDGPSQMGLEDIAMFHAISGSIILYPADAVSALRCVEELYKKKGIGYLRTTRGKTPVIYSNREKFPIGGSKIHRSNLRYPISDIRYLIITAGITLFETLEAQKELAKEKVSADVLDCYSVKPIDAKTIKEEARGVSAVITVEDHWSEGGLGDAVLNALADTPRIPVYKLAVTKMPRSGKTTELLAYEGIDKGSIISLVKKLLNTP